MAELELSDARAPPTKLNAATVAVTLARTSGPSRPTRAHHQAKLNAATVAVTLARTSGAEVELSAAHAPAGPSWSYPPRTHQRAELNAATVAATHAATVAATLARTSGAELKLSERGDRGCHSGVHQRAELELSGARTSGPSWSCPPRAHHRAELNAATVAATLARTSGPSWSCPERAPPSRAGAVRRARHGAEVNMNCSTRAPGPSGPVRRAP